MNVTLLKNACIKRVKYVMEALIYLYNISYNLEFCLFLPFSAFLQSSLQHVGGGDLDKDKKQKQSGSKLKNEIS